MYAENTINWILNLLSIGGIIPSVIDNPLVVCIIWCDIFEIISGSIIKEKPQLLHNPSNIIMSWDYNDEERSLVESSSSKTESGESVQFNLRHFNKLPEFMLVYEIVHAVAVIGHDTMFKVSSEIQVQIADFLCSTLRESH